MKKSIRIILIGLLVVLVAMQFIRPDFENPPVDPQQDFLTIAQPSAEIAALVKDACYDCHSHETTYPWYANVAPASWILQNHILEGREHLNFSKWGTPDAFPEEPGEAYEEIVEVIQEGEMPLWDYKLMHPKARLTETQKNQLVDWFKGQNTGANITSDHQSLQPAGGEENENEEEH